MFNSVLLSISYMNFWTNKVNNQGVVWNVGPGVPPCVIQEPIAGNQEEEARGKVNAEVIQVYSQSSYFIVASCYDKNSF